MYGALTPQCIYRTLVEGAPLVHKADAPMQKTYISGQTHCTTQSVPSSNVQGWMEQTDELVQGQDSKVSNNVWLLTRTKHIVKLGKL